MDSKDFELYQEEQRQLLIDIKKEIADNVTLAERLVDIYKAPSDEIKVSGEVSVNTEKEVAIKNIEGIYNSFIMLGDRITDVIERTAHKPLESVTVKNIEQAKTDKVAVTNLDELKKEIQQLSKDFIATVEQLDLNVNVEKQDLPTQANKPIAVRLSDGKSFYNAMVGLSTAIGSVASFIDSTGSITQVQLTDGKVPITGEITSDVSVKATDSPSIDAFARWRVSYPETIFDSKQIFDNAPLFWDDQEVSGSGTTSTHSVNTASTTIGVSANTAGRRIRQTFMRFNYQPGKSQLILLTGTLSPTGGGAGITRAMGQYDDNNGIFMQDDQGVIKAVIRSNATGTPIDNKVAQADWNIDTFDGNGPSGITLNPTASQIVIIDYEWLGVGRVRIGFVYNGIPYYVHEFNHANISAGVYMSTPNNPLRYEISNDGTGSASSLEHICSSVMSEGGVQTLGILRHKDSGAVSSLASGTLYAVLGIKLKAGALGATISLENVSTIATSTNDQAHWELILNPTVAGTFTYSDVANSAIQTATGTSTNTVTGGIEIDGGYFSTSLPVSATAPNALKLGASIAGVTDTIVLCCRPITNNITVQGSLTWREES